MSKWPSAGPFRSSTRRWRWRPRHRSAARRFGDLKHAVEHCADIVESRGLELIVLDCSRPEIEFAAARVVVPGMRHFWARLGKGRLYQAPVEMGLLSQPLREDELNPVAF